MKISALVALACTSLVLGACNAAIVAAAAGGFTRGAIEGWNEARTGEPSGRRGRPTGGGHYHGADVNMDKLNGYPEIDPVPLTLSPAAATCRLVGGEVGEKIDDGEFVVDVSTARPTNRIRCEAPGFLPTEISLIGLHRAVRQDDGRRTLYLYQFEDALEIDLTPIQPKSQQALAKNRARRLAQSKRRLKLIDARYDVAYACLSDSSLHDQCAKYLPLRAEVASADAKAIETDVSRAKTAIAPAS